MTTALACFIALFAIFGWVYRGGSTGLPVPYTRFASLLATPLAIFGALALINPPVWHLDFAEPYWNPALWPQWTYWALALALFTAAQADGWGRQMDLGANDKPDNETGYRIRDLFFKSKSSFARDLTGLFMRFTQFSACAVAAYFWWAPAAIIPASLMVAAPLIWVAEHKWFRTPEFDRITVPWNPEQRVAYVEWGIGLYIALVTILIVLFG